MDLNSNVPPSAENGTEQLPQSVVSDSASADSIPTSLVEDERAAWLSRATDALASGSMRKGKGRPSKKQNGVFACPHKSCSKSYGTRQSLWKHSKSKKHKESCPVSTGCLYKDCISQVQNSDLTAGDKRTYEEAFGSLLDAIDKRQKISEGNKLAPRSVS